MADLFDIAMPNQKSASARKSKKVGGLSIGERIIEAKKAVEGALGNYKDQTETIMTLEDLTSYFENSGDIIAIDTETMGLNYFSDYIVGISMCDGGKGIYIPLNHAGYVFGERTQGQLEVKDVAEVFRKYKDGKKWVCDKPLYENIENNVNQFIIGCTVICCAIGSELEIVYE